MGWIKLDHDIHEKPEVIAMACDLGMDRCHVVGYLVKVWIWADKHTTDGNAPSVTKTFVDSYLGVTNFANAMQKVGWLDDSEGGICIPKFDRHNGEGAKKRIQNAARQAKFKVQKDGNAEVTLDALPEKKRKEYINTPPTPSDGDGMTIPSVEDVYKYASDQYKLNRDWAKWFHERNSLKGWKDSKGEPYKNWKLVVGTYFKALTDQERSRFLISSKAKTPSLQEAREAAR